MSGVAGTAGRKMIMSLVLVNIIERVKKEKGTSVDKTIRISYILTNR